MSFDEIYAVIGVGGCGRSAMPIAREEVSKLNISNECLIFVDDDESSKEINGQRVMSFDSFVSLPSIEKKAVITVADPKVRHAINQRCLANNITPWSIRSENSIIMDDVVIGVADFGNVKEFSQNLNFSVSFNEVREYLAKNSIR